MNLNTKQIYVTPPQQTLPAIPVQFAKPLSYEFRVAEHIDDHGNIERVGLQIQVSEHDEYGAPVVRIPWMDVPRVKINNGLIV
jgi:hypothetical protein